MLAAEDTATFDTKLRSSSDKRLTVEIIVRSSHGDDGRTSAVSTPIAMTKESETSQLKELAKIFKLKTGWKSFTTVIN